MADDTFDEDQGPEAEQEPGTGWNPAKEYRKLKKQFDEYRSSEAERLAEAERKAESVAQRRYKAQSTFEKLGFPKFADLYMEKVEGEPTEESVKEFLSGFGVNPSGSAEPKPQVPQEVKEAAQAFQQPVASQGLENYIDTKSYLEMVKDPARRAEAKRALDEGRVKFNNPQAYEAAAGLVPRQ